MKCDKNNKDSVRLSADNNTVNTDYILHIKYMPIDEIDTNIGDLRSPLCNASAVS